MKALRIVAVFLFALTAARSAQALPIPISFTDTFNPTDVLIDGQASTVCTSTNAVLDVNDTTTASTCEQLKWTHTLTGFLAGDNLTTGNLTITAYNDGSNNNQGFDIVVDLLPAFTGQAVTDGSTSGLPISFTYNVVSQLSDGTLNVTLTSDNGNHTFYFAKSVLNAAGTRDDGSGGSADPNLVTTPEPASLALLGTGLIFAGNRIRARRSKAGRTVN